MIKNPLPVKRKLNFTFQTSLEGEHWLIFYFLFLKLIYRSLPKTFAVFIMLQICQQSCQNVCISLSITILIVMFDQNYAYLSVYCAGPLCDDFLV